MKKLQLLPPNQPSKNQLVLDVDQLAPQLSEVESSGADSVNEINTLLGKEDFNTTYPRLSALADKGDQNSHFNVMTGLMALSVGKKNEAARYFERALQANPNDTDALHNSAVLALSYGDIETARNCFVRLTELHPADASVYNDLGVVWMNQGHVGNVKECFTKSLGLNPNFEQARKNALEFALTNKMLQWGMELLDYNNEQPGLTQDTVKDIHRWQQVVAYQQEKSKPAADSIIAAPTSPRISSDSERICNKKIAIFANYKTFVTDIIEQLKRDNNDVREFTDGNTHDMFELMAWADLAWFEWCDNLLIEATKYPKQCPIVCRLHSYEAFSDMPTKVDWSKVDQLVFVNRSVEELVRPLITGAVPWTVIHNGVDCNKFQISSAKVYGKKIASVGYINYKKNPTLLLYCFKKIHDYDPEYTFHIAGAHQDARIKLYFDNFLKENPLPITFYGWVDDMAKWYADKDFVISTSLFESFHYSIAEGMTSGLLPLIHNWYGAQYLYPTEYMFGDPDSCLKLLSELEKRDRHEAAENNRRFIMSRYNSKDKFNQISGLLKKVVSK